MPPDRLKQIATELADVRRILASSPRDPAGYQERKDLLLASVPDLLTAAEELLAVLTPRKRKRGRPGGERFYNKWWEDPAMRKRLGNEPDYVIAHDLGFTHATVSVRRRQLGIPKYGKRP